MAMSLDVRALRRPAVGAVRFGIVLPIHNEEELLPAALAALDRAITHVAELPVCSGVAIVLDACDDSSADLVRSWRSSPHRSSSGTVDIVETTAGNVGHARRMGVETLLRRWSAVDLTDIWLATTDADSVVPLHWISSQLAVRSEGGQVWAGTVTVDDWSDRSGGLEMRWRQEYASERLPVHGANFGIEAALYVAAGGFDRLATGEDRDLLERTEAMGAVISHDRSVPVVTSSRRRARAPGGFAHALSSMEGDGSSSMPSRPGTSPSASGLPHGGTA
jgi:hypothetical protein